MQITLASLPPKMLTHISRACLSLNFPHVPHILVIVTRHTEGAESYVLSEQVNASCSK